ncbi:MAG: hypothetical protein ACUVV4_04260 [Candidatus Bathyarchaeia archaeon]
MVKERVRPLLYCAYLRVKRVLREGKSAETAKRMIDSILFSYLFGSLSRLKWSGIIPGRAGG